LFVAQADVFEGVEEVLNVVAVGLADERADVQVQLAEFLHRVLKDQPPFLPLQAPIIICGDIHGQLHDLQRIFRIKGMPPESRYLFMGD
jgi:hypothetical protein